MKIAIKKSLLLWQNIIVMDQPKIERVLALMMHLTNNHYTTIKGLSERFDMSERTIYRYIDTLKSAGFVIKKDKHNVFRIDKSSPYFKEISDLVYFSPEEAYILKSAIDSIDDNNLLKQNLKKKLYSVYDYKLVADIIVKPQNKNNVHHLLDAIENEKQVRICDYQSSHSNSVSTRLVEPIEFTTNLSEIWCYEVESRMVKLFKVARIASVEITENGWQFKKKHVVEFVDIFRFHGKDKHHIVLSLTVRAANLLKEEYPLSEKYLQKKTDTVWILDTDVASFEGVGRFILGLYNDITIVESNELRRFVKDKIESMK